MASHLPGSGGNSFGTRAQLTVGGKTFAYHSLPLLAKAAGVALETLPYSTKILLENLLRQEDGDIVKKQDIEALLRNDPTKDSEYEIQFMPARVLLQDFTGVPVVADLGAMRSAVLAKGGDPEKINPLQPVDLVIDHSVQVDFFGTPDSMRKNVELEYERNGERYQFLKWGQGAFKNFQAVPPATGICHQVNLEFLAHVAMVRDVKGTDWIYPDSLVGTDSHTPMVNGIGVVGWGVGGIEAEAAMLGQPCSMLIPQVIGFELRGRLPAGSTATDLVLTVTQMLRKRGVVGKFVEYFGDGVGNLSIADRATIGNMAPEYGATIGIFPVDQKTIDYLRMTGRTERAERAESYFKAQGLWHDPSARPTFTDVLTLDLASVEPSLAGPSKPHDRSALKAVRGSFRRFVADYMKDALKDVPAADVAAWTASTAPYAWPGPERDEPHRDARLGVLGTGVKTQNASGGGGEYALTHGSIVIAAITSCTNTSNPSLMIGAALLARNAAARGLKPAPWVKTSFAPGSKVVTEYLADAGLQAHYDALGFNLVGYGCTTCIGNSGPLPEHIGSAIEQGDLATVAVLSGNRNFEARIHPLVLANYLASPPLVVAYALAGNINVNLTQDPLGQDKDGKPVFLKDIWPNADEVGALVSKHVTSAQFGRTYADVFTGDEMWQKTKTVKGAAYEWSETSTYIRKPPFLEDWIVQAGKETEIKAARVLGLFGDFITTDHISPAGNIGPASPAGKWLLEHGVAQADFNSYGARRGNHEVMIRGTFANVRIKNRIVERDGGFTKHFPDGREMTIFEASEKYAAEKIPLVVFGGKEYGSGSSRDWAAKGTRLLGVRAVVAESFERIHRSNLVGMGVLPLQFMNGESVGSLGLKGDEVIDIVGLDKVLPGATIKVGIRGASAAVREVTVRVRIDTPNELRYYRNGGILPFVLGKLM